MQIKAVDMFIRFKLNMFSYFKVINAIDFDLLLFPLGSDKQKKRYKLTPLRYARFCLSCLRQIQAHNLAIADSTGVQCFAFTQNQHNALKPLEGVGFKVNYIKTNSGTLKSRLLLTSFFGCLYLYIVKDKCRHAGEYLYKIPELNVRILEAIGYPKLRKLDYVIMANDHSLAPLSLLFFFRSINTPCGYVQHAHITDNFPSPHLWRHLFLDGPHASRIYTDIMGIKKHYTEIVPSGPVRFSTFNNIAKCQSEIPTIGVAFDLTCTILEFMRIEMPYCSTMHFIIRFHPRTPESTKDETRRQLTEWGLVHEEDAEENSLSFLRKINLCCAPASSSILLDALFMRVPSAVIGMESLDYYGFLSAGICNRYDTLQQVITIEQDFNSLATCEKVWSDFFYTEQLPVQRVQQAILNFLHGMD